MTRKICSFIRFLQCPPLRYTALIDEAVKKLHPGWAATPTALRGFLLILRVLRLGELLTRRIGGLQNGCGTWRGLQRTVAEQDGRCLLLLLTLISTSSSFSSSPEKPPTPGAGSSTAPRCPRVQDFSWEPTTFLALSKSRFHISKGNVQGGRPV